MSRWLLALASLLLFVGCRDTPDEVLRTASEAAAGGDIVEMRELFSIATTHRLEHAWRADGTPEGRAEELAGKLVFNGGPMVVEPQAVQIHGDFARVVAKAGADTRAYYMRKEDGRWRIDLGGGTRYRKAERLDEAQKGEKGKEEE